jgi:hypothetical protein
MVCTASFGHFIFFRAGISAKTGLMLTEGRGMINERAGSIKVIF